MRILVLNGSYRAEGGTAAMVEAFCTGAREACHQVDVVNVARLDIHGCRGCEYCHNAGGDACMQHDDMDEVYPLWDAADMIVVASPVYYDTNSWNFTKLAHIEGATANQMRAVLGDGSVDVTFSLA